MDSSNLKKALHEFGEKYVFDNFLMNEDVHLLQMTHGEKAVNIYHSIKVATANILDIPVKNIAIVGSAKTGFSLTPGRKYAPFGEDSDLDLVIVSEGHFKQLWESYLNYVNTSTATKYNDIAKNVFKHFISIKSKDIDGDKLKYFNEWISKVDQLRLVFQTEFKLPHEVNYRVYETWKYVEQYHITGLSALLLTEDV